MKARLTLAALFCGCFTLGYLIYTQFICMFLVPKVIHYVWVGDKPVPNAAKRVLKTWQKYAPDYEIKKWDETNCDVHANPYISEAYALKRYEIVSDWCRFVALYNEGGLYFDVDHYLKDYPKDLEKAKLVFSFQDVYTLSMSGIRVAPKNPVILRILNFYNSQKKYYETSGPSMMSQFVFDYYPQLKKNGEYQKIGKDVLLLPSNYYMLDFGGSENKATHNYHNSKDRGDVGEYYNFYSNMFLADLAYFVNFTDGSDYLIPIKENRYYRQKTKQKCSIENKKNACILVKCGVLERYEQYCLEGKTYKLKKK